MREGGRNNSLGNLMTSSEEQGMLQALRFLVGLPERSETMQKGGVVKGEHNHLKRLWKSWLVVVGESKPTRKRKGEANE